MTTGEDNSFACLHLILIKENKLIIFFVAYDMNFISNVNFVMFYLFTKLCYWRTKSFYGTEFSVIFLCC